jgi:AbrB family looped-hinge helix DNA binding protein
MKNKQAAKFHKAFHKDDKFYGTTTLGARGQVVIPAQARKDLKLKPGDHLVVMGKFKRALGLIKSDQLRDIFQMFMDHWAGTEMGREFKLHAKKVFGDYFKRNHK